MNKIFISYRRDDAASSAGRLRDKLRDHFGHDNVFMDVDNIGFGEDFEDVIRNSLQSSIALIAVIGCKWLEVRDEHGRARLNSEDDLVRREIVIALELGITVIPTLVDNAELPRSEDLPSELQPLLRRHACELTNSRWDYDTARLLETLTDSRLLRAPMATLQTARGSAAVPATMQRRSSASPFSARAAILDPDLFFDREHETRMATAYIDGRQNCQIVGPRRIGKSSFLHQIRRSVSGKPDERTVVYLDFQDPRLASLSGWIRQLTHALRLPDRISSLSDLAEEVESFLQTGIHPVVLLDEFGAVARRKAEFDSQFLLTLRYLGQLGVSFVVACPVPLSHLTDPSDETSPFFNTFPLLPLGDFSPIDAERFVRKTRPGVAAFTDVLVNRVLAVAGCHPLRLQIACFHIIQAMKGAGDIDVSLRAAQAEIDSLMSSQ